MKYPKEEQKSDTIWPVEAKALPLVEHQESDKHRGKVMALLQPQLVLEWLLHAANKYTNIKLYTF